MCIPTQRIVPHPNPSNHQHRTNHIHSPKTIFLHPVGSRKIKYNIGPEKERCCITNHKVSCTIDLFELVGHWDEGYHVQNVYEHYGAETE